MNVEEVARRCVLAESGLKAAQEPSFSRALRDFQAAHALDDLQTAGALSADRPLRRELSARLCVTESFFFRQPEHLACLVSHVELLLSRGKKPHIWSAGCARGEEPYSAALALWDRFGERARRDITITATDIDPSAMQVARTGLYSAWSLRGMSQPDIHRRFRACEGGFRVTDAVLGWPRFFQLSIQEHLATFPSASVDILLFRNVGIYLTHEALASLYAGFSSVLTHGGLLLQSVTDPGPGRSDLIPREHGPLGAFVQNRLAAQPDQPAARPRRVRAPRASRPEPERRSARSRSNPPSLQAARAKADAGQVLEAVQLVSGLLKSEPQLREGYILRGQLLLHHGNPEGAVDDLRAALLLAPEDSLARYWYSLALDNAGRHGRAVSQRNVIVQHLANRHRDALLEDGETTVGQLLALLAEQRESQP